MAGRIGSSLQACVYVYASGAIYRALASLGDELKYVLQVSDVTLVDLGSLE
ncbi:MAG: hypothetical protein ACREVW_01120 [Burkholderiales bacterium]